MPRLGTLVALSVVAVASTSCGSTGPHYLAWSDGAVRPAVLVGRTLLIPYVTSCYGNLHLVVTETATTIRAGVTGTAAVECSTGLTTTFLSATLRAPLGTRRLLDLAEPASALPVPGLTATAPTPAGRLAGLSVPPIPTNNGPSVDDLWASAVGSQLRITWAADSCEADRVAVGETTTTVDYALVAYFVTSSSCEGGTAKREATAQLTAPVGARHLVAVPGRSRAVPAVQILAPTGGGPRVGSSAG